MPDHVNPYIAGAPVIEKKMFFGREGVFDWISNSLSGKYVDHILVIHGQRRVGKTSVLKHLPNRLPADYITIFIDLQGRVSTSLGRFLGWLAREIVRALKQEGIDLPRPDREKFQEDPEYFETVFLPQLEQKLGEKRLLLTFDEFDTLESTNAQEGLALPFMAILKRLMDHHKLNFVFSIGSSGRKLENMQAAYTGFFKQALYRKISFLDPDDGRDLITKPVEGVVKYSVEAIQKILSVTNGHPYFIQLICHELFSECQKADNWAIGLPEVNAVLGAVIERGTVNLKFVWDEASDLEKWLLALLAETDERMNAQELEARLKTERVRFTRQDLERSLVRLKEKDVLRDDNSFVIHLLRIWLQQNRSIEQVREELEEVNPIISRLLEIGQEYHAKEDFDRAIQSFDEALREAPDNLEAHLWMGNSQLGRGDYGRAASEFEAVLEITADDVVAQKGFCDAYLAMGDDQRLEGKLEEAEYAYQQVLTINPNHEAAQKRMAELFHKRAVTAVLGGEEAALAEISRALEYNRQEGFEKIADDLRQLIEGKKNLAAVLLSWGQRAQELELWEEARELLEAYRNESGDEDTITRPLSEVREQIRTRRLTHLQTQASRFTNLGRFEEAIETWQNYLKNQPEDSEETLKKIAQLQKMAKEAKVAERGGLSPLIRGILIAGSIIIVGVMAFWLAQPTSPLMSALIDTATPTAVILPTATTLPPEPTPTHTQQPTATTVPTPTPIPLSWTRVNSGLFLPRDTVTAFVFDPIDPEVMYLGTLFSGVYKTINGGITWQPAQVGIGGSYIDSMVINPNNPEILYVGVVDDGLYKTTNGGQTWEKLTDGLPKETWQFTSEVAIDSNNPDHLFYTEGFDVYETTDDGENWKRITNIGMEPFSSMAVGSDGSIYVTCPWCEYAVYRIIPSESGGMATFEGLLEGGEILGDYADFVTVDRQTGNIISGLGRKLYTSLDNGATWQFTGIDCYGAAFAESGDALCIGNDPGVSRNHGQSWSPITSPANSEFQTGGISPYNPDVIILAGSSIYKSTNGGRTWAEISSGLGNAPTQLLLSTKDRTLYLEEYFNGQGTTLYAANIGDRDFELINESRHNINYRTFYSADGTSVYRLYENKDNGRIYLSKDGGSTYQQLSIAKPLGFSGGGEVRMNGEDTLYISVIKPNIGDAGHQQEESFFTSTDDGETWQEMSYTLQDGEHGLGQIVADPTNPDNFYGLSANLYFTNDGGEYWYNCYSLARIDSLGAWISGGYQVFSPHPENSGHFFLATKSDGLYKNHSDSCRMMERVPLHSGLDNDFISSVMRHPENPDTIYVGTAAGVYISYDGGDSWGTANDGLLGALAIYSLVIDPENPGDVYASTPYGIFKLEDR